MKLPYYPPAEAPSELENLRANLEAYKDYVAANFEVMQNRIDNLESEVAALKKKKSSSRKNKTVDSTSSSLGSEKLDS